MAENAQDANWPQDAGPSTYTEPKKVSTAYLDSIKESDPATYKRIADLAKFTANENFGGQVQDYQAQLFTPLSSDILKGNKTLDLSSGLPDGVRPITEEVASGQMDNPTYTTNLTGYSKDLGVVNGVPITAVYDADGKLTGYQGDSRIRTFIDGSHSVSGQWDASGKPVPQSYSSHSGGFLGDIMSDPLLGTLAAGAAATFGGPLGSAALSLAQGKGFDDVLSSVAKGYALGSIGSGVSSAISPELTDLVKSGDLTASQAANLAKTVGGVASNVVAGADPLQALVNGGISAGTSAITSQIPGFDDLSKSQQRAVNSAVVSTLKGGDPTPSLINEALVTGISAVRDYSPAPSSALVDQTIDNTKTEFTPEFTPANQETPPKENTSLSDLVDQNREADFPTEITKDEEVTAKSSPVAPEPELTLPKSYSEQPDQSNDDFYRSIGIEPSSLSDTPAMETDPLVGMSTRGDYNEITGKFEYDPNGSMEAPLDETTGTNLSSMDGYSYDPTKATWESPDGTITDLSYLSNTQQPMDMHSLDYLNAPTKSTDLSDLAKKLLSSNSKASDLSASLLGAGVLGSLLGGSDNTFTTTSEPVQNQGVSYNPQAGTVRNGVAYGLDQLGRNYTTNAAEGGIMSLAHGGQIPSLGDYAAGGNPRLLRGPGDGMSDNIPATIAGKQPARLADGEFVIPADVVSHLGNGSTEAGANVLYQMMERVRKARTGNPKQGKQINPQKFVPSKGK